MIPIYPLAPVPLHTELVSCFVFVKQLYIFFQLNSIIAEKFKWNTLISCIFLSTSIFLSICIVCTLWLCCIHSYKRPRYEFALPVLPSSAFDAALRHSISPSASSHTEWKCVAVAEAVTLWLCRWLNWSCKCKCISQARQGEASRAADGNFKMYENEIFVLSNFPYPYPAW